MYRLALAVTVNHSDLDIPKVNYFIYFYIFIQNMEQFTLEISW